MSRIYLDSNIYSKLRNNSDPKFQKLNELIAEHKDNLSFTFSIAHIRDKEKDNTEHKFEDFKFIESITKDNYLAYHPNEKRSSFYLASPSMVYADHVEDDFDVRSALNIFNPSEDDDPLMKEAKALMSRIMNTPMPGFSDLTNNITEENRTALSKILPLDKPEITMVDFMTSQIDLYEEMMSDHQTYKDLRKLVDEGLNNGRFTLQDDIIDLNLAFKDSVFKKTYLEYVMDSFNKKEGEHIPYYDYFVQVYNCLDLLGISKDKITKKNNYSNLFNDGLHSYFGHYNDYLVTDDESLRKKSMAVYKILDIKTQVLSVDEFIELLPTIGVATEQSAAHFIEKLSQDIEVGERDERKDTEFGYQCHLFTKQKYLNFFDLILEVKEDDKFHFLIRKMPAHWLSAPNFREKGMILDRCIDLFGEDLHQKGKFNFEQEIEELRNDTWPGRYWRLGNLVISLQRHHALNEFCLIVTVLPHDQPQ